MRRLKAQPTAPSNAHRLRHVPFVSEPLVPLRGGRPEKPERCSAAPAAGLP